MMRDKILRKICIHKIITCSGCSRLGHCSRIVDYVLTDFVHKGKLREIVDNAEPILPDVSTGLSREEILDRIEDLINDSALAEQKEGE